MDRTFISASDGKFSSPSFPINIEINPINDEAPELEVSDLDCRESDVCELSSAIKIKDLDTPDRQINIELGRPKFGIIINKVQAETVNNARSCNGKHCSFE